MRCSYCEKPLSTGRGEEFECFQVDHVDPLVLGGDNTYENLALCCRRCNSKKCGKPREYLPGPITRPTEVVEPQGRGILMTWPKKDD